MATLSDTISEGAVFADSPFGAKAQEGVATDLLRVIPAPVGARVQFPEAVEGAVLSDVLDVYRGVLLLETLQIADPVVSNWIGSLGLSDGVRLSDTLRRAITALLQDQAMLADSAQVARAAAIVEQLGLLATMQGTATYHLTISQVARLSASLGKFLSGDVTDGVSLGDDALLRMLASVGVADGAVLTTALAPQLLVRMEVDETITVDAEMVIRALFSPEVNELVDVTAAYLAPDGSFTTWSANVFTAAVTEYRNYVFNSFARLGPTTYIGASADGLFELVGDSDNGTDIVAMIRSGLLQFGGTHLSRLKSAYLAVRGESSYVLKIATGDGAEYVYAVDARNMRSTKVHMGKGQRSRYFAFELISEGADFDLDTLEFVPIVMQRRV